MYDFDPPRTLFLSSRVIGLGAEPEGESGREAGLLTTGMDSGTVRISGSAVV